MMSARWLRGVFFAASAVAASLVGGLLVGPSEAYAACDARYNVNISATINDFRTGNCSNIMTVRAQSTLVSLYDSAHSSGGQLYFVSWVSPRGAPHLSSVTVDAGSSSAPLQLNTILFRGRAGTLSQGKQHLSSDSGTAGSLKGEVIGPFTYPGGANQFKRLTPINFTFPLNPYIYADTTYTVPIKYKGVLGTADRSYHTCLMSQAEIDGGTYSRTVANLDDIRTCSWLTSDLDIRINIRSHWQTAIRSQLYVREPGQATFTARGSAKLWSDASRQIATVPVGSEVYWRYTLQLTGASKGQNFTIRGTNDRSTAGAGPVAGFNASGQAGFARIIDSRVNVIANTSWTHNSGFSTFTIPGDAVGSVLCERVRWSPVLTESGNPPTGERTSVYNNCVQVTPNHNLTPTISGGSGDIVPGNPVTGIRGDVRNDGDTPNTEPTHAGVVRFVLPNGTTPPAVSGTRAGVSPTTGFSCQIVASSMPSGARNCRVLAEREYDAGSLVAGGSNITNVFEGDDDLSGVELNLGDRVCFITVVNRYTPGSPDTSWRYSAPACSLVAKVPSLQVSGGDVYARNSAGISVHAPARTANGELYGSWAEYGVFGTNQVEIASGGSLMAALNPSVDERARLIFANTLPIKGSFGVIGAAHQPTLPASWGTVSVSNPVGAASLANARISEYTGNLTLSGGTVSRSAALRVNGAVQITGNITYANPAGGYTSPRDLPQLIIIADEIRISASVNRVDAWLIARNGMVTCGTSTAIAPGGTYYSGLNDGQCNSRLTINGPVQTERILLRRTAGAEGTDTEERRSPAEVFNLRSDAYIWAQANAGTGGTIRIESIKELPPRF